MSVLLETREPQSPLALKQLEEVLQLCWQKYSGPWTEPADAGGAGGMTIVTNCRPERCVVYIFSSVALNSDSAISAHSCSSEPRAGGLSARLYQ